MIYWCYMFVYPQRFCCFLHRHGVCGILLCLHCETDRTTKKMHFRSYWQQNIHKYIDPEWESEFKHVSYLVSLFYAHGLVYLTFLWKNQIFSNPVAPLFFWWFTGRRTAGLSWSSKPVDVLWHGLCSKWAWLYSPGPWKMINCTFLINGFNFFPIHH